MLAHSWLAHEGAKKRKIVTRCLRHIEIMTERSLAARPLTQVARKLHLIICVVWHHAAGNSGQRAARRHNCKSAMQAEKCKKNKNNLDAVAAE